jgi:hypothetical protein
MMKLLSILLVLAISASQVLSDSGNQKQCPGGYDHGTQMDIGRYWYECRDGQVVPKGCLADDGHRVDVDATFDTGKYRMQCVMGSDGYLTLTYKACILNGAEHDVGSQWDDSVAYFTCVKEGDNVRVITLGCVDQGKPLKLDDRLAKGDYIYQCKKATDGTPRMNKVGCVFEGRKYNIGETYEGQKFWYTCTDTGSRIVGCMFESHRLRSGDHFTKDDMMYSCKVDGDQTDFVPFACLQREENGAAIERKVDCSWVEGHGSEAYEYTCKADSGKVEKVQTQCVYRAPQGVFKLKPGCVQLAETFAVGCRQDTGSGRLQIETFSADKIDNIPDLRQC